MDESHTETEIRKAAVQAIENAVRLGEENGFSHDLADDVSFGLVAVESEERRRPKRVLESNSECAWRQYDEAKCPDCGEDIPHSAVRGEACKNCGHVWAWGSNDD
jgi:hypothetical protein